MKKLQIGKVKIPGHTLAILIVLFNMAMSAQHVQDDSIEYELYLTQIAASEAFLQLNEIGTARDYLERCKQEYRDLEWYFLDAFLDQSDSSWSFTRDISLNHIALSHDGKKAAVGGSDGIIRIVSMADTSDIIALKGHISEVKSIDFSRDGSYLISGDEMGQVILWNLRTNQIVWRNEALFTQAIQDVVFSPNDRAIGVASSEIKETGLLRKGFTTLLHRSNGREITRIDTDPYTASALVFANRGRHLIVASWGERVHCYIISTGEKIWEYDLTGTSEYNAFHCLDISPDGRWLALGSADHQIHMLNTMSGEPQTVLGGISGHRKTIHAVQFSRDGQYIASAGDDRSILIWDIHSKAVKHKLIGHTKTVTGVQWGNDGTSLYSVAADGHMKSWKTDKPFQVSYEICQYGPWQAPVSQGGQVMAAPCSDNVIGIYDTRTGNQLLEFKEQNALCADYSNDGRYLVTSSTDGIVRLWDLEQKVEHRNFNGHEAQVLSVAYINSKKYILSVGDTTLRIWIPQLKVPAKVIGFKAPPVKVLLNRDETLAFVGLATGEIKVLHTSDWTESASYQCRGSLNEMAISPDGRLLGAINRLKTIEVWNLTSGRKIHEFTGHEHPGYAIGFSPDSRYLITGAYDHTFKLWNIETGYCTLTFHGYKENVYTSQFLDERILLIGSSRGTLHYYDFR